MAPSLKIRSVKASIGVSNNIRCAAGYGAALESLLWYAIAANRLERATAVEDLRSWSAHATDQSDRDRTKVLEIFLQLGLHSTIICKQLEYVVLVEAGGILVFR